MSVIFTRDKHQRIVPVDNISESLATVSSVASGGWLGQMGVQDRQYIEPFLEKYKELAKKGTPEDKYRFGKLISTRKICKENDQKALPWMKKAAECGHIDAMIWVGIEEDNPEWLKKAIEQVDEQESRDIKRKLLSLYLKQGKIEEALSCVENPGHYMYSKQALQVGTAFLYGNGIKKDIDKAIYYLEQAAEKEDQARLLLAQIYLFPEESKEDIDEAISWIEKIEDSELSDFMLGLANNKKGEN